MSSWEALCETQPLASKIIMNSIEQNRISHAYLIAGAQGTGKRALATLLAKSLFCEHRKHVEPCQQCHMCRRVQSGNHPDVFWLEREGQSIGNEQVDLLRKESAYYATETTQKLYIINDAHTLTVNAANRLLKFIEEPDVGTTILLLTNNRESMLPTIRSRCQMIDLQPLDEMRLIEKLVNLQITENNARLLSALTNNIEEAVQLDEEKQVYVIRDLTVQFIHVLLQDNDDRYLFIHEHWLSTLNKREELELGFDILLIAFNDILRFQIDFEGNKHAVVNEELIQRASQFLSRQTLLHMIQTTLASKQYLLQNVHPTLVMEQFTLQL